VPEPTGDGGPGRGPIPPGVTSPIRRRAPPADWSAPASRYGPVPGRGPRVPHHRLGGGLGQRGGDRPVRHQRAWRPDGHRGRRPVHAPHRGHAGAGRLDARVQPWPSRSRQGPLPRRRRARAAPDQRAVIAHTRAVYHLVRTVPAGSSVVSRADAVQHAHACSASTRPTAPAETRTTSATGTSPRSSTAGGSAPGTASSTGWEVRPGGPAVYDVPPPDVSLVDHVLGRAGDRDYLIDLHHHGRPAVSSWLRDTAKMMPSCISTRSHPAACWRTDESCVTARDRSPGRPVRPSRSV
jgi:hypothetical protein